MNEIIYHTPKGGKVLGVFQYSYPLSQKIVFEPIIFLTKKFPFWVQCEEDITVMWKFKRRKKFYFIKYLWHKLINQ